MFFLCGFIYKRSSPHKVILMRNFHSVDAVSMGIIKLVQLFSSHLKKLVLGHFLLGILELNTRAFP